MDNGSQQLQRSPELLISLFCLSISICSPSQYRSTPGFNIVSTFGCIRPKASPPSSSLETSHEQGLSANEQGSPDASPNGNNSSRKPSSKPQDQLGSWAGLFCKVHWVFNWNQGMILEKQRHHI